MKRYLFPIVLILFLAGSIFSIPIQEPDNSIFYDQRFDIQNGWTIQGASAQEIEFLDEFDGPAINRAASIYMPKPRFSLTANPGHLRLIFPGTAFFDHWLGNDAAPALFVQAPAGNWVMTTRTKLVQPAQGGFFHTGLMVRFSQFSVFYWGIYRFEQPTELRLERTGIQNLLNVNLGSAQNPDVELMIAKDGSTYTFSYRFPPSEAWILAGSQTDPTSPQFVGLIGKTWVATNLIVDFDYLRIEE